MGGLDNTVRQQFKRKLRRAVEEPAGGIGPSRDRARLLQDQVGRAGYRMMYQARDATVTVVVVAIGKRERSVVYCVALTRVH